MYERPYATDGETSCTDEEKSYIDEICLWSVRRERLLFGSDLVVSVPTWVADGKTLHIVVIDDISH
jgi:hypothetical protein